VPQGVIGQAEQAYTSPYHERHWWRKNVVGHWL
jgi:hypothetical protein